MGLDISFIESRPTEVYSGNITHNLTDMAKVLGCYDALWCGRQDFIECEAHLLAKDVDYAIKELQRDPGYYSKFDAPNGWGTHDQFLKFLIEIQAAIKANPFATVQVST